jgi:tryptophan synthase alpha chain
MSSIDTLFARLRADGRKALMPFLTAGDPDLAFTADVLREVVAHGASLCELGIPYSDPVADGPVIQASYSRVLSRKTSLDDILAMLGPVAFALPAPVVTMVSYAIVYRHGLDRYVGRAKAAGVAGLIVPDLPVEESGPLAEVCRREDMSLIHLVTPTTSLDRAVRIAERTTGFIYYVSITGITGERTELPPELIDNVARLREKTPLPICIGFGISKPEHVQMLAPVADGLIVGSAIVRRMAEAATRPRADVIREIGQYVGDLVAALAAAPRCSV